MRQAGQDQGGRVAGRMGPAMRSGLRHALAVLLISAVVACTPITRNYGYVPPEEDLALIEVGRDTRETVAATVGRPSTNGLLNDVGWFYVQSRFETIGPLEPREIDREVVAISFDENGVVSNIERFGLEDGQIVALSRRVTEPNVKAQSFLAQLFANLGRISADQFIGSQ